MLTASILALAASLFAVTNAQSCDPATQGDAVCSIRAAFGPLVPGIVPVFLPTGALIVGYDNINAIGGAQQLAPSRVANPPRVAFNATPGTTSGPLYTFLMVDPDAPTPQNPTSRSILHYMVTNLQVDPTTLALGSGTLVAPYAGPNPPQGSTFHRYVMLLYTQPANFALPASLSPAPATVTGSRIGFDFVAFAANAGLGNPVGGMYFGSAYDGSSSQGNGQDRLTNPISGATAVSSSAAAPATTTTAAAAATTSATSRVTRMVTSTSTSGTTTLTITPSGSAQPSVPVQSSPAARLDSKTVYAFVVGGIAAVFEGAFR